MTYDGEQIWVAIQPNNAPWVQPLPHGMSLFPPGHTYEFVGTLVVDCFWLEEENQERGYTRESSLEPEDVAP